MNKKILLTVGMLSILMMATFVNAFDLIEITACHIATNGQSKVQDTDVIESQGSLTALGQIISVRTQGVAQVLCDHDAQINYRILHQCTINGDCTDSIIESYTFTNEPAVDIVVADDGSYDIYTQGAVRINGLGVCLEDGTSSTGGTC